MKFSPRWPRFINGSAALAESEIKAIRAKTGARNRSLTELSEHQFCGLFPDAA
jgi:hypothetical protein